MLIRVTVRAPSRSESDPPASEPTTAPAPYTPSASPAWVAEKPRSVRNSTR